MGAPGCTPGLLRAEQASGIHKGRVIEDATGEVIATVQCGGFEGHGYANAVLFAAAPEMYAALDAIIDCWDRGSDGHLFANRLIAARAALAKARGEK